MDQSTLYVVAASVNQWMRLHGPHNSWERGRPARTQFRLRIEFVAGETPAVPGVEPRPADGRTTLRTAAAKTEVPNREHSLSRNRSLSHSLNQLNPRERERERGERPME